MPTSDAALLPAPLPNGGPSDAPVRTGASDEPGSARRLDDVGVENVLEAMVEQRRRSSRPPAAAQPVEDRAASGSRRAAPSVRARAASEVFLKVR